MREVALPDALRAHEQLVHRARDRSRQAEAHDDRDDLDDEEQARDEDEQEQQDVAERLAGETRLSG